MAAKQEADLLKKARKLFRDGLVLDAAKLGIPRAQGDYGEKIPRWQRWCEEGPLAVLEVGNETSRGWRRLCSGSSRRFLGQLSSNGRSRPKRFVAARDWFKKSADQDSDKAQFMLGKMLIEGKAGRKISFSEWD